MTNRVTWEVGRILGVYRERWTGTETFHRDGKQELGMGDCQLRNGHGQTRHMYLVMLAYRSGCKSQRKVQVFPGTKSTSSRTLVIPWDGLWHCHFQMQCTSGIWHGRNLAPRRFLTSENSLRILVADLSLVC